MPTTSPTLVNLLRRHWTALCLLCLLARVATAAQVVYLVSPATSAAAQQQIATAASFYGLDLETLQVTGPPSIAAAQHALASPAATALVIDAEALSSLQPAAILAATTRNGHSVPVLLSGITAHTDAAGLRLWSAGAITGSSALPAGAAGWQQVGAAGAVTRELRNTRLPLGPQSADILALAPAATAEVLIVAHSGPQGRPHSGSQGGSQDRPQAGPQDGPVFVRISTGTQQTFFATAPAVPRPLLSPDPSRQQAIFAGLAAPLLFLRYAAGDRAWHTPGAFANFTIDDLWLREPYGHVNYEDLLEQSQRHNFHTTIAFIPWNYDRSQPAVVSLYREHPDRLSIAIHGNDHIHQEFGPLESHPLAAQQQNIAQALLRMSRFEQLTGLPFDRVMIFPHSVAPQATFAALRQANFLGTANSLNVPSDQSAPSDDAFALRTATLNFGGLASLRRYSVESDIAPAQLAIDAFLGNPTLFYAHESFFSTGAAAFNQVADETNQLEPQLRWVSLGEIMRHLYLERVRDDGDLDILASSPSIDLDNPGPQPRTFRIARAESSSSPLVISVNGQLTPYQHLGEQIALSVTIPPHASRRVEFTYPATPGGAAPELSSHSLRTAIIRLLSDFRDNTVSRSSAGRWFIRSYVAKGPAWNVSAALFLGCLGLVLATLVYHRSSPKVRSQAGRNSALR